jgi:histidyl-tRNA synthetase
VGKVRLTVYGCTDAVAEGLVVATSLAVLRELGHDDLGVAVNCVGDRRTRREFIADFKDHVKDSLDEIRPTCRQRFKKDPLALTSCNDDTCRKITESGPDPVNYLRKAGRVHLKEICEYLESLSVPYEVNARLTGSTHHHTRSTFHIKRLADDSADVLARGERHQHTAGEMDYCRSIHATSASIDVPGGRRESYKSIDKDEVEAPPVYHLHLGHDARKYSLSVLEQLRQADIAVLQTLSEDKLREQISMAERMDTKFAVLVGLKEARENTVIVRNMRNQSQTTVSRDRLTDHLKQKIA